MLLPLSRRFESAPYTASVTEQVEEGKILSTRPTAVRARDDDLIGHMTYELIGQYPAQDFFIVNQSNAEIQVSQDLRKDSLRSAEYRLQLVSYDSVYPGNKATAMVTVSVERNPKQPVFVEDDYSVIIDEKHKLGTSVLQVKAEDDDEVMWK